MIMTSTRDIHQFKGMLHTQKDMPVVISEGDSWFGYPDSFFRSHQGSNIIDHIADTKKFNILRMESNGDDAGCMMVKKQKAFMIYALQEIQKEKKKMESSLQPDVSYILFSGGGNDIVGQGDMPRFLNSWEDGMTAHSAIHWGSETSGFQGVMEVIRQAYETLIEIRDEYSPDATIMTHGYDKLRPSGKKAIFLGGLISSGPWLQPFMLDKGIKDPVIQQQIVNIMIEQFNNMLIHFEQTTPNFIRIDTLGTIKDHQWINEIHPNKQGFKNIAAKFLKRML